MTPKICTHLAAMLPTYLSFHPSIITSCTILAAAIAAAAVVAVANALVQSSLAVSPNPGYCSAKQQLFSP
jgi:hypothetical protein